MVTAIDETRDLYIRMAFVVMKRTIPQHIRRGCLSKPALNREFF